jgi:hypothetical protein
MTIRGQRGVVGNGSLPLVNQGLILSEAGQTITVQGNSLTNLGVLSALSSGGLVVNNLQNSGEVRALTGGVIDINSSLELDNQSTFLSQLSTTVRVSGHLLGNVADPQRFSADGKTAFDGSGTVALPQLLEVMSQDLGANTAGFTSNFVYGTLQLANNTYVRLVDQSDNSAGMNAEALYVNSLIVPAGCTLDLNGLHLYTRAAQLLGSIVSGSITQIPDGGSLTLGTGTPGTISLAGELDEWTFFGRAGETVMVVVDPGSGSATPPYLNWVQARLVDTHDTVIVTSINTSAGQVLVLPDTVLPTDGVYRVQVRAHPDHSGSTGNYTVTVWEVTLHLTIEHSTLSDGQGERITVSYPILPRRNYTVESRNTLGENGSWQPLPGAPHNNGSVVEPNVLNQRFYRVWTSQ